MSRRSPILAVSGIAIVSLVLVALSSLFGVYGDGSAGAAPGIFGIGALWYSAFPEGPRSSSGRVSTKLLSVLRQ